MKADAKTRPFGVESDHHVSELPIVLDVPEAARQLNLSIRTIRRLLQCGALTRFRSGRRVGVLSDSVRAYALKGVPHARQS